jgi:hypothetical protein
MITLDEFLKRFPARVDQTTKDEIQLFIDTVLERSGLAQALSDVLAKQNPLLDIAGDANHASLLIPLKVCSQGRRKTVRSARSASGCARSGPSA